MARIAGNQAADRHPRDDYPTDPRWTRALMDVQTLQGPVWEPAAGEGKMAEVLSERYSVWATSIEQGADFLESTDRAPSIVTNPPYRLLDRFIQHGLAQSDRFLCLLTGWHSLAGGQRRWRGVWSVRPPTRAIVIPERMKVNGAASQFNHVWLVWDHQSPSSVQTSLEWVSVTDPTTAPNLTEG